MLQADRQELRGCHFADDDGFFGEDEEDFEMSTEPSSRPRRSKVSGGIRKKREREESLSQSPERENERKSTQLSQIEVSSFNLSPRMPKSPLRKREAKSEAQQHNMQLSDIAQKIMKNQMSMFNNQSRA